VRRLIGIIAIVVIFLCLGLSLAFVLIAGGSPRCWRPATGAPGYGSSARVIQSGGERRCYLLYLPEGLDLTRPSMLVVSLHGFSSRPEGQEYFARWQAIADREGFLLVYPQGTRFPLRWNASAEPGPGVADDVQFIRDLLQDLDRMFAIDPARIYINGMSNGGAMTHRLACEMADVFAAAGVVAGPIVDLPGGCTPARPMPIVGFHGTADPVVSYGGGTLSSGAARRMFHREEGLRMYSAQEWAAGWGERNGCQALEEAAGPGPDIRTDAYSGCRDGGDVVLYTIEGGGHTWPGGPNFPFLGRTTQSVNASEVMLEFFLEHPLPTQP